jgi:hypothetical protein
MTSDRRFEEGLPRLLDELYVGPMPAYRDQLLQQTARIRQRPAWSFLERWLPMVDVARQPLRTLRMPWRTIGLVLVVLALIAAMVFAFAAGSQPPLPAPFGLARTGLVAYDSGGDIYTADPVTGVSTVIVRGPETDINPRWSRDGTTLVFERRAAGAEGPGLLFVVHGDGSNLMRITPDAIPAIASYAFSPDGKQILISSSSGAQRVLIAAADGTGIRPIDTPHPATSPTWRPPNGSEILFTDSGDASSGWPGIYTVDAAGGKVRTIREGLTGRNRSDPQWSPNGAWISYVEWSNFGDGMSAETHVMAADGSRDRVLPIPPGAVWQAAWSWSNDSTRLLAIRGTSWGMDETRAVAIPADGSGFGVEIQYPGAIQAGCCSSWEWAPNDQSILGTPVDETGAFLDQVLLDPAAGTFRTLPWTSVSHPSFQRLAP